MCGIPYHAASNYIRKIISKSQSVAICEQVESPSDSKGLVKREVVRVITPGTVIEDDLLKGESNNFLLSLYRDKEKYGLIFLDVSTGDFMGCSAPSASMMESEISRMPVREAVISEGDKELKEFFQTRFPSIPVTLVDSWYFTVPKASDLIKDYFSVGTLKGLEIDSLPEDVSSSGRLVAYLKDTQKKNRALFKKFRLYSLEDGMMLDRNAQENLELVKNQQDSSKKNTLFEVLDYTDTAMGRRLLHSSILRPLTDSVKIRQRLNAVEELLRETDLSMQAGESLKGMSDMERILARAGFGSCNARDLLNLKETLQAIPGLIRVLKAGEAELLKNITTQLDPLIELTDELEKALKESPPLTVKEGGIVKKGYSPDLDELIEISSGDKKWISTLEETEKKRLGIPTLKVGYNRIHGYYIEITKAHIDKIPDDYHRKQTLVNSERYITEELKMREDSILGAEERKAALEYKLFTELREKVTFHTDSLQKNASLIALIDFLRSLSLAAQRQGYIKPSVGDYDEIDIKDGRHPVVEVNMPVSGFIPNDTKLNSATEQVMIITGPNMAGKSTYLK
ncbi:MAG: DNA mismatch repair protein MutS, partial [Elusimicrobia bacterium]|nr:DNA mismatch repair protein MutS [Elusimicrobiota bacterium]